MSARRNVANMHVGICLLFLILATVFQPDIAVSIDDASIHVKDGMQVSATKLYLQKGQTQRITCLPDYEDAVAISFYRVSSSPDGTTRNLLLRAAETVNGGNFSLGPRYQFTPDYRLVIVLVEEGDSGMYLCQKVSTSADGKIEKIVQVVVLDKLFPPVSGLLMRENVSITVQRDAKDISLPCPIKEASTSSSPTVYWSMEVGGHDDQTRIITIAFSDGELITSDGFGVSAGNGLLLATAPSTKRASYLCHVSSTEDDFDLQSAKVTVEVPDGNSTAVGIAVSVAAILLLLLAVLIFVCYKRKWNLRRTPRRANKKYTYLSGETEGPIINAGGNAQWKHECNLGPKGIITKAGNTFTSIKSVAVLKNSKLAVLDDSGVHIFSADLGPLKNLTELPQPPENYVAMVSHSGKKGLLLGARDGTVYLLDPTSWKTDILCSLSSAKCEGEETTSDSKKKISVHFKGLTKLASRFQANRPTPSSASTQGPRSSETAALGHSPSILKSMTVDENGSIFLGDETTEYVTAFYSNGDFMNKYTMQLPHRNLAARSAGEFFALDIHGDIRLFTTAMGKAHERVFIKHNPVNDPVLNSVLKPVNVIVDNSESVFVVSDTRCGEQNEVIQFDKNGNFLRQFVQPWRGVRGLRFFQSGERLAVYDKTVVRIYNTEPSTRVHHTK